MEQLKNCPRQKQILEDLTFRFWTVRQIVSYRRISKQMVYWAIGELKKKGLLERKRGGGWKRLEATPLGGVLTEGPHRLHAEHFRMEFTTITNRYRRMRKEKASRIMGGNRVLLHKDSAEVRSHTHFFAATQEQSEDKSYGYWPAYFKWLQEALGAGWKQVERCMAHYAYMNSEIARRPEYRNEKLMVINPKTGKVIFKTDGSLGIEDEAIGKDAAITRTGVDSLIVDRHEHPEAPVPSVMAKMHMELVTMIKTFIGVQTIKEGQKNLDKQRKGVEGESLTKDDADKFRPDYMG